MDLGDPKTQRNILKFIRALKKERVHTLKLADGTTLAWELPLPVPSSPPKALALAAAVGDSPKTDPEPTEEELLFWSSERERA